MIQLVSDALGWQVVFNWSSRMRSRDSAPMAAMRLPLGSASD